MGDDTKIRVPIRRASVEVDARPWHTLQPWWPSLEALLAHGHTVSGPT